MVMVIKPWNPRAEVREYLTRKDDVVPTHVVIARGTEQGVMMEHHYLTDMENVNAVKETARLYDNWRVIVVPFEQYLQDRWAMLVLE